MIPVAEAELGGRVTARPIKECTAESMVSCCAVVAQSVVMDGSERKEERLW